MRYLKKKWIIKSGLLIIFLMVIVLFVFIEKSNHRFYYIKAREIDNTRDIIIANAQDGFTGRFPDVISTNEGLLAAYYWNSAHAPCVIGDSLGVIKLQRGSEDGLNWDTPYTLIDSDFLIEYGLGLWKGENQFYDSQEDAELNHAEFCIEARDPNFALIDNHLVLTFFTRIPWDSGMSGHSYYQYNEDFDYTYGRTYIMASDDEGKTWSRPVEIKSEYLDRGCAKRGNIAVLDDRTMLIPLYGYSSEMGSEYTTANIYVSFNNGNWEFIREYCSHLVNGTEERGVFDKGITEVSFSIVNKKIYALVRPTGDVYVSTDEGLSWDVVKCIGRGEEFSLHQPSLQPLETSNQILASWAEPNDIGGRDLFLMLYSPQRDDRWRYSYKYCIYKNEKAGDMGDPTSILLSDNAVLTIYYDAQKGIVAATNTILFEIN